MITIAAVIYTQVKLNGSDHDLLLHKMLAFESLFEGMTLSYRDTGSKTEYKFSRLGGKEALAIKGKTVVSLDCGLLSRRVRIDDESPVVSIAYGTTIFGSVRSMSADMRTVLFWLGARAPGDIPMSSAFLNSKDITIQSKKKGGGDLCILHKPRWS